MPSGLEGSTYCVLTMSNAAGAGEPDPMTGKGAWFGASAGIAIDELLFTSPMEVSLTITADSFYDGIAPNNVLSDASERPGQGTAT